MRWQALLLLMVSGLVFGSEEAVVEVTSGNLGQTEVSRDIASTALHATSATALFWWSFAAVFIPGLVFLFVLHRDRFRSKNF